MNPVSVAVWTLEENYWLVMSMLASCFCYFVYTDRRHGQRRRAANDEIEDKTNKSGYRDPGPPPSSDDDEGCRPALAVVPHVPYNPPRRSNEDMVRRSTEFLELMRQRRTVRLFSTEPVPDEVIRNIIATAGTSPSGAHTEPWTFVVVQDSETKAAIRDIVEQEEEVNYASRMSRQWVADLKPFRTVPVKQYLTEAPVLVLVFRQAHSKRQDGGKRMHYYSEISVAIAAGILLAAIQYAGLVALTSTPLNSGARLRCLLGRPTRERLELLLPVGRPHRDATVPDLQRKPYADIAVHI